MYRRLRHAYGPQHWWPADSPFEVAIGAILTQSTSWSNVEKAIANLKGASVLSPHGLKEIHEEKLAVLLRPSGYFNVKTKRVKAFINHLWEHYQGQLDKLLAQETSSLRTELLSINGIGEETADDIIVYAAGKPSFVIDAYTKRILSRMGLSGNLRSYTDLQMLFHRSVAPDPSLYNEFHALIVRHGKYFCNKTPKCKSCCMLQICPTGTKETRRMAPDSL